MLGRQLLTFVYITIDYCMHTMGLLVNHLALCNYSDGLLCDWMVKSDQSHASHVLHVFFKFYALFLV